MSDGFTFKLEKILDIRKKNEEKSAVIFNKARSEKEIIKNKLETLEDDYKKHSNISKYDTVAYQKIKRIYMQNVTKAIEITKKELKTKEFDVDKKRQDVLLKQIDRKTVEKLKENQYKDFIREKNRVESVMNDEFALFGHFRKIERR